MRQSSCFSAIALAAIAIALLSVAPRSAHAVAGCPTAVLFTSDASRTVIDVGWTGNGHGLSLGEWAVGLALADCTTTSTGACGACRVTAALGRPRLKRCRGASWMRCQADSDCTSAGASACTTFLAPPIPNVSGGGGVCAMQQIGDSAAGGINVARGELRLSLPLALTLSKGPSDHPCPRCVGDPVADDGATGGSCDSGPRARQPCDAQAQSSVPAFGATSLDCPPEANAESVRIAVPSSPVLLTSDSQRLTVKTDSPAARAIGFQNKKSLCDVCADEPTKPCQSNADCASGVCGASDGRPPALNACDDGVCTLGSNGITGECRSGPFEGRCRPSEPFRSCQTDAECGSGDTCQGAARKCFAFGGQVGDSVGVATTADAPVRQLAHPTLGALLCGPATRSTMANDTYGLPGPIRLQVPGTLSLSVRAGDLQ
jgi:hypothetical protein